ncbi:MAG TPA: TrmO family methyltransferase [Thermoanaerobaculia bacterium]|nr:TrmO family methyltransferase [Thermoanaerobaculia bacterium]
MRGVFSTRSADRPNPIGLHRVQIVEVADPHASWYGRSRRSTAHSSWT